MHINSISSFFWCHKNFKRYLYVKHFCPFYVYILSIKNHRQLTETLWIYTTRTNLHVSDSLKIPGIVTPQLWKSSFEKKSVNNYCEPQLHKVSGTSMRASGTSTREKNLQRDTLRVQKNIFTKQSRLHF